MKKKKGESYLDSFREYQDKMNLPGYYTAGRIHPALKAKTKAGGYALLIGGIFLLCFYLVQLVSDFSIEKVVWVFPIGVAVLLIIAGMKLIKRNGVS